MVTREVIIAGTDGSLCMVGARCDSLYQELEMSVSIGIRVAVLPSDQPAQTLLLCCCFGCLQALQKGNAEPYLNATRRRTDKCPWPPIASCIVR